MAGAFIAGLFDDGADRGPSVLSRLATIALFLATLHATGGGPGARLVRWTGLTAIIVGIARFAPSAPEIVAQAGMLLDATFLIVATVVLLIHLMRSRVVDTDMLIGSLCIYLLIGMVWALGYLAINSTGSAFISSHGDTVNYRDLLYFSYVTLTTLGYGDVLPHSPPAQTLAVFEAVLGQFYVAVLVARLLGLHIAHARNRA